MLIRYGLRIAINVAQPTPVLALLDVHPDRRSAIASETQLTISGFEVPPAHLDIYGIPVTFRARQGYDQDVTTVTVTTSGPKHGRNLCAAQLSSPMPSVSR